MWHTVVAQLTESHPPFPQNTIIIQQLFQSPMGHQLLCKGQLIWSVWIKSLRFIIKDVLIHMLNPFRGGSNRSWHVSWIHNNSQTTLTYYRNRLLSLYVCPHRINWNWKCYVPLWCTPNSLALSNQVCEAITNQSYECRWILKWGWA